MLLPPQADVPVCEDKGKEMRMLLKRLRYLLAVALAVGIVVVGEVAPSPSRSLPASSFRMSSRTPT